VFFNLGESKIPEKYYNPPPSDKLLRYYSLLDTIARRMAVSPHATLTITAMLSGDSLDAIREMRTEKIQNYLRNRGNILPRQLQLRTTIITYPADPTLREEAERVIISSDDAAITAPMVYYDTIETSNPPVVRFLPNIISDEGVETWRLSVFSGGALVKEFSGQNDPPTEINWNLDDEKVLLHSRKPLIFELLATNYTGDTTISRTGEIRFVPDTTAIISGIEVFDALEYSIVFFDYNSSEIAQRDRASLMMLRRYCTQKTTEILGATDALGEEEYNRILSQKRAEAVAKIVGLPRSTARGLGSAGAEFSNDLPEGRMFNRRVRVSVSRRQ
jgi:AraC-like DNA-binding protein